MSTRHPITQVSGWKINEELEIGCLNVKITSMYEVSKNIWDKITTDKQKFQMGPSKSYFKWLRKSSKVPEPELQLYGQHCHLLAVSYGQVGKKKHF